MTHKLRTLLAAGVTLVLGGMLLATIYFTLFDLQWIVFLAGVLSAAVAAVASQVSRAQWLVARRTKQYQQARDALAEEVSRRERAAEAQKAAEGRLRFVNDALPVMVLYVDRDEHCRYHNRAFAQWCARRDGKSDDLLLREVLGDEIYQDVQPRCAGVLNGLEDRFDAAWKNAQGTATAVSVNKQLKRCPPWAAFRYTQRYTVSVLMRMSELSTYSIFSRAAITSGDHSARRRRSTYCTSGA